MVSKTPSHRTHIPCLLVFAHLLAFIAFPPSFYQNKIVKIRASSLQKCIYTIYPRYRNNGMGFHIHIYCKIMYFCTGRTLIILDWILASKKIYDCCCSYLLCVVLKFKGFLKVTSTEVAIVNGWRGCYFSLKKIIIHIKINAQLLYLCKIRVCIFGSFMMIVLPEVCFKGEVAKMACNFLL